LEDSLRENKNIPHRYITKQGYRWVSCPKHHFVYSNGHVPEHRLVWEKYHKACLLPWVDIHHINGIKIDNEIENLQAIYHGKHAVYHNKVDMSGRKCVECGSTKTTHKQYRYIWYKTKNIKEFLCFICWRRNLRKKRRLERYQLMWSLP
jgi:hypothetical protein